ncbi:Rve domain containing hypothetical protein [Phytophthora palmivora]|uniref:Integrase catalytic domain-containing protein n=1 Tax=Phytophthora palmivora TaxID=4796 RepID=A0A2P4X7P5_9STRA|nr:Rve domain containing hypothetical protein [Phytophthora palmivora]
MANEPGSEIEITDYRRDGYVVRDDGKQTRARQPSKDTGKHTPIRLIGEVIFSDLKGPITPHDRCGNLYLVNFVDRKSNYYRVFLVKTKDEAARKFEGFLVFLKKEFDRERHSEANNQAANGKAERKYRSVMSMIPQSTLLTS